MQKTAQVFFDTSDKDRYEQAKKEVCRVLAQYDTYIVAEVEDLQISSLEEKGFTVQERPEFRKVDVGNVEFEAEENREDLGLASFGADDEFYVLQFVGPAKDEWIEILEKLGVIFRHYVPNNAYVVKMWFHTISQVTSIRNMMFIRFITKYIPEFRISSRLKGRKGVLSLAEFTALKLVPDSVPYDPRGNITVMLQDPVFMPEATHEINELGGKVVGAANDIIIVAVDPSSGSIEKIAENNCVKWIEPYKPPRLCLDKAAPIINAPVMWNDHNLDGADQIVAVADTGLDRGVNDNTMHPDFRGRIKSIYALGRPPNDARDNGLPPPPGIPNEGHGTHVAGIVLGNGASLPKLQIRGIAHAASLVFQSTMDAAGGLGGIPVDLNDLFRQAYDDKARIHNNSWGTPLNGLYSANSLNVDQFVWDHRDMVIVIAAGNEGTDPDSDGIVDLDSLCWPGTAKNCITVGGCENNRPHEINLRWGRFHNPPPNPPPNRFMNTNPIRDDLEANNSEGMMAISGRGPTDLWLPHPDCRVKPDMVAPGSSILSTKSSLTVDTQGFGVPPVQPHPQRYMFMSGTSMATPQVSGAAAIVRQYLLRLKPIEEHLAANKHLIPGRKRWRKKCIGVLVCGAGQPCQNHPHHPAIPAGLRKDISPTAALVKAVLIHGARRMRGQYANPQNDANPTNDPDSQGRIPNNSQGFGRLDLEQSLFPPVPTAMELFDGHAVSQDEKREYQFLVRSMKVPLKATLVWTDAPEAAGLTGRLVNDLTMIVYTPDGKEFHGNFTDAQPPGQKFDIANNVEKVIIRKPAKGIYRIEIRGSTVTVNIPGGRGQDFALVVSADLTATLKAILKRSGEYPANLLPLPALELCNKYPPFEFPVKGNGPLVKGDARSNLITRLQKMLVDLGFDIGAAGPDGIFGDQTEKAVEDFQGKNKDWEGNPLKVDKEAGPRTSDALNRAMVGDWYDKYTTPLRLTKGALIITLTKDAAKKMVAYDPRSAKKPTLIIKDALPTRIILLTPNGNRFGFPGEAQFKVLDKDENALEQGKTKKEDVIKPQKQVNMPFTVELEKTKTFYTFYGEEAK